MKRIGLVRIYEWGLLGILLLISIHAPLVVAFGTLLPEYSTVLKAWKELALAGLGVTAILLITRHKLWSNLYSSWVIRLSAIYIVLHLMLALFTKGEALTIISGLMIDLRFVAMFMLSYVAVLIRPESIKNFIAVVAAGALLVLGFGILQITVLPDDALKSIGYSPSTITPFTTIDSNPDYVRINSTLRGPNPLGAISVVYAALAAAYIVARKNAAARRRVVATGALVASAAVLFASYSRSAYVAFVVALSVIVLSSRTISKRYVVASVIAVAMMAAGLAALSTTDWYSNVILHEDPESKVVSKSNDGHIESLADGAKRAIVQPFGAGIGSTGSASLYDDSTANDRIIENYYLYIAHESGWLGLGIFLSLFAVIIISLWKRRSHWATLGVLASGLGLAVIGLLLPVWADDTVAIIWWGIAGALIAPTSGIMGSRYGTRSRKQTATRTS